MTGAQVIEVARQEIGYIGKKTNAQLDDPTANVTGKFTKYARDLNEAGYYNGNKNGFAWCPVFVDWCIWTACGHDKQAALEVKPVPELGASCAVVYNMFKNAGRLMTVPSIGAQILYDGHTGLVADFDDVYVRTIEGNWNNRVSQRTLRRTDAVILGYGLPFYEVEPDDRVIITREEYEDLLEAKKFREDAQALLRSLL